MPAVAQRAITRLRDADDFTGTLDTGEFLTWNGTAFQLSPVTAPAIGGSISGGTAGSVLFVGTGPVFAQDNASFQFVDADNALVLAGTPPTDATKSLLRLGSAIVGGDADGTYIGINAGAGYAGHFLHAQEDGQTRVRFGNDGNGYGDKVVLWANTDNARLLTVTGDGRFFLGGDTGLDNVLTVNFSGVKTTGNLFGLGDGTYTLTQGTTQFSTNSPNFAFGANNAGSALAISAPNNFALVVKGSRIAVNNGGDGTRSSMIWETSDDAGTIGLILQAHATQSAALLQCVLSDETTILVQISNIGAALFRPLDAATNSVTTALTLGHHTSGTPAAGFGGQQLMTLESSTTENREAAAWRWLWNTTTDASRIADIVGLVWDTAEREWIRGRASGTAPMVGFLGATPVVRQTVAAAATDLATVITLANDLRTAMINLGLAA